MNISNISFDIIIDASSNPTTINWEINNTVNYYSNRTTNFYKYILYTKW